MNNLPKGGNLRKSQNASQRWDHKKDVWKNDKTKFFFLSLFLSFFLFLHKVIVYWLHPEYQCPTYINTASQIAFLTSWSLDAARHSLSLCVRLCVPAGVCHCVCACAWTKKGERERGRECPHLTRGVGSHISFRIFSKTEKNVQPNSSLGR